MELHEREKLSISTRMVHLIGNNNIVAITWANTIYTLEFFKTLT